MKIFLYSSSVYCYHLFLISSAPVRFISYLSFIVPIFAWNIPLVSLIFLKRSLVFPILLFSSISLITEEGFLISPCYSLELCIIFSFLLCLSYLFFSHLFVRRPQTTIVPFCISFSWGWFWLLPLVQCYIPPSVELQALSIRFNSLNLSLPLYNCKCMLHPYIYSFSFIHQWTLRLFLK